jgi:alkanesulfonate monooxygenase SsuD/methylene tetrahydromethanopterin reductase-like flavin-dependent oxidoreductase (luciferase family)
MAGMELRVFTEPQQGASYDDLLRVAQTAEELGFGAFFRSDHFLGMGTDGLPGPTDSWVTLGAIARETSRIRLGTLVTSVTFRSPGLLAIQVAQVDQMSGGRVELGIGAGWFGREHAAYGSTSPDPRSASTCSRTSSRSSPGCGRPIMRLGPGSPTRASGTRSSTRPGCRNRTRPSHR